MKLSLLIKQTKWSILSSQKISNPEKLEIAAYKYHNSSLHKHDRNIDPQFLIFM